MTIPICTVVKVGINGENPECGGLINGTPVGALGVESLTQIQTGVEVGTATIIFEEPHGLTEDIIGTIRGADQPEYNLTLVLITIVDPLTVTYDIIGDPDSPATGDDIYVIVNGIPVPPEGNEVSDIIRMGFGQTYLDGNIQNIFFDEVVSNELGGAFDINGVDPSYPFNYEAAENGIFRMQMTLVTQVANFTNTGPNNITWYNGIDGDFDNDSNNYGSFVWNTNLTAGAQADGGFDTRTITRYLSMIAGQKAVLTLVPEIEVNAGVVPDLFATRYSTLEFTKVGEYNP